MEWVVLLPIFVSIGLTAAVFILIYKIPPGWVSHQAAEISASLEKITDPTNLGDAIHHAVTKNDSEILTIVGEEANGIVHEAIPAFSEKLANEAVALVSSMYSKGVAKSMGESSGAARGYLALPGIQKAALKTGAESMLGGALGNFLPPEIAGLLTPEMIQGFLTGAMNPGNSPQQQQGPVEQARVEWRPPV